jgi:hypothetical protein
LGQLRSIALLKRQVDDLGAAAGEPRPGASQGRYFFMMATS